MSGTPPARPCPRTISSPDCADPPVGPAGRAHRPHGATERVAYGASALLPRRASRACGRRRAHGVPVRRVVHGRGGCAVGAGGRLGLRGAMGAASRPRATAVPARTRPARPALGPRSGSASDDSGRSRDRAYADVGACLGGRLNCVETCVRRPTQQAALLFSDPLPHQPGQCDPDQGGYGEQSDRAGADP